MEANIQDELLQMARQNRDELLKQNELYLRSIESSEKKTQELIKLQSIEQYKLEELEKQNKIKELEIEQQKFFNESLKILIEQNKIAIDRINVFMNNIIKTHDKNPLNESIMLMLTFMQTIQMPIMVEIVKHMGVNVNKDEYIRLLSEMATKIGSARTNINQNSGMNVNGDFKSDDFQFSENSHNQK